MDPEYKSYSPDRNPSGSPIEIDWDAKKCENFYRMTVKEDYGKLIGELTISERGVAIHAGR